MLFISLEMAAIELIERMLCSCAKVNGHRLRNGTLAKEDQKRLFQTAKVGRRDGYSLEFLFIADCHVVRLSANSERRPVFFCI